MVREDTLMRFIRILSDLSNQLRSAASKRVLLEIALIKMCRPETQNDEISVLERVRRLEKQIESGVVVHQAQGGSYGYGEDYQDQDWPGLVLPVGELQEQRRQALPPEMQLVCRKNLRKKQLQRICRK